MSITSKLRRSTAVALISITLITSTSTISYAKCLGNPMTVHTIIPDVMETNFLFFIITPTISSSLKQGAVMILNLLVMRQHRDNVNHNAHFK